MKVAVCTVGIDGWDEYTKPLIDSIIEHEPDTTISVIDNNSENEYSLLLRTYVDNPDASVIVPRTDWMGYKNTRIRRTKKTLCYGAALNLAHDQADEYDGPHDWYIFLGNDTLCTGPFYDLLKHTPPGVMAGSGIYKIIHYKYISGWGMVIPRSTWEIVGRFDEDYIISAWEDVDYAYRVQMAGLRLHKIEGWPIIHMDQEQRQKKWSINHIHVWNGALFERKHNIPLPLRRYSGGELLKDRWA
jgi:GT2 family glycosyltransferase